MTAEPQDQTRDLDPFGFMEGHGSAIRPLGGKDRSPDPRYAFHTLYVDFDPGRALITIHFDQLRASFGELRVNINAFIPGSGRDAIFVTSARLHLDDKVAVERGISIPFMTVAGATYAAYGYVTDGTDAQASGITIRAELIESADAAVPALLPTTIASIPLEMPSRLVVETPPSFAVPVSQVVTDAQLAEPDFAHWAAKLAPRPGDPVAAWRLAFVAKALDGYGMLRPGARGIGWGEESLALSRLLATAGCDALLAPAPAPSDEGFAWIPHEGRQLAGEPDPDGKLPVIAVALGEEPADRRGFDFLWSIGMVERSYAAATGASSLIEMMAVLRPGGFAVHVFDVDLDNRDDSDACLQRAETERLAVTLIARGFSVVQLNFEGDGPRRILPFGLIVRKD